jgi:hypothetical protein
MCFDPVTSPSAGATSEVWDGRPSVEVLVIIFNVIGVVQAVLAAVPGAAVMFLGVLIGSPALMAFGVAVFCGSLAVVDLFWRARSQGEGDAALRMILPWKGGHFFFVPNWLGGAGGALLLLVSSVSMIGYEPPPKAAGEIAFDAADDQIDSFAKGEAARGNTPAAVTAAEQVNQAMELFASLAISGADTGEMRTFVHQDGDTVVVMVHVPDLRKYNSEAKRETGRFAWQAAQTAARELSPRPAQLAVGIRGVALYDDVLFGRVVEEGSDDDGILRHGKRDDLYPLFAPAEPTTAMVE